MLNLKAFRCRRVEVSFAVVTNTSMSPYSPATRMCISGTYFALSSHNFVIMVGLQHNVTNNVILSDTNQIKYCTCSLLFVLMLLYGVDTYRPFTASVTSIKLHTSLQRRHESQLQWIFGFDYLLGPAPRYALMCCEK